MRYCISSPILPACFIIATWATTCHAQNFEWASRLGGTSWDESIAMAVDEQGNAYFGGWMYADFTAITVDGPVALVNHGEHDAIFGKYSPDGELLWVYTFGDAQTDYVQSVAIDPDGNVVITGRYSRTVDVEPGAGETLLIAETTNATDVFIIKYTPLGELVWARSLGGASSQVGYSVACDSQGNVFSIGGYNGTIDMDPGIGTALLASFGGAPNIYLSKLDANGNFLYGGAFGSTVYNYANDIHVDVDDNVFVIGSFSGAGDFDPGPDTLVMSSPFTQDPFLSKFNNDCDLLWIKQFGGGGDQYAYGVTTDSQANILLTGSFMSAGDFDPGPDTLTMTPALMPFADIYVVKLDPTGDLLWAKQMGGDSNDHGRSIATDASDRVYTTGYFTIQDADFDPGPGEFWLDPSSADVYISVLDADGNFVWAGNVGANDEEKGYAVAVDGQGKVFVTGSFHNTPDFDMGPGVSPMTSAGEQDIFMMKYNMDPTIAISEVQGASFTAYPNPAKDLLFLSLPQTLSGRSTYTVADIQGRRLLHGQLVITDPINIGGLANGVYILTLHHAGQQLVTRFIKE